MAKPRRAPGKRAQINAARKRIAEAEANLELAEESLVDMEVDLAKKRLRVAYNALDELLGVVSSK